jgi:hypothetical protein
MSALPTREHDVRNGRFRPLSGHYLRAGFDASGKVTAWHHRVAADRITPFMDPVRFQAGGGRDGMAMAGTDVRGYDIRINSSSSATATPGCAPIRCAASGSRPTSSPPRRSWTKSLATAASTRSPSGSNCSRPPPAPTRQSSASRRWPSGAQTRRPRARTRLHRLFRQLGRRHCRDFARPCERADQGA